MPGSERWSDGLVVGAAQAVRRRVARAAPEGRLRWGRFVGNVIWLAGKRRRQVAVGNIGLAFPELSLADRTLMARRSALHFGYSAIDFMCADTWTRESIELSTTIEGYANAEASLAGGKGALLIMGHLGNWERVGAYLALRGADISFIVRDANQAGINQMVTDMRRASGAKVIPRGDAARPIITALRSNGMVGILPDQNTDEAFIPFFGHPAGTVLGPGVIRERTGASILPAACYHLGGGRYHMKFWPLLEPDEVPDGRKGEGLMRAINRWLEDAVRDHPEQYLWMHDRWRAARQRGLVP